ncbi:LCP family protein [Lentzea tibetensis]|uniref:LCP family protein n=1 Tax=Lentzea tibetensis TaxID=2591470 RepID=UPI001F1A8001|nr:LCP family protein [Lentzea tibetensis]
MLVTTGVTWHNLTALTSGVTTQDVIAEEASAGEPSVGERPADGSLDVMLVGVDSRTDARGNPLPQEVLRELQAGGSEAGGLNTDTLIMVHIPNNSGKAFAVSFPRDSYVEIAGGFGRHKINSAYAYGRNAALKNDLGELDARREGAKNLIATVEGLAGVRVDHYAEVNLAGFYEITKVVGGVEVCLRAPVNDRSSGVNLPAGRQSLEGRDALAFVRQRAGLPLGDLDRVVRQQVFMAGLAKKMLSAGVLADSAKRADLIRAVTESVVIDEGWDITDFAVRMSDLAGGNMSFRTIPTGNPGLRTEQDGLAVEVDDAAVRRFVSALDGPPAPAGASVAVEVINASGVPGLAGQALRALASLGYAQGDTANAERLVKSVVRYGRGGEADAVAVQQGLGGMPTMLDETLPDKHVRVYVGRDYPKPDTKAPRPTASPNTPPPITANDTPCVN